MRANRTVRVGVLAFSVVLVGAYVGWRVVRAKEPAPGDAGPSVTAPGAPGAYGAPGEPAFGVGTGMGSSKSAVIYSPPADEPRNDPTLFYGTKSAPFVEPKDVEPKDVGAKGLAPKEPPAKDAPKGAGE